MWIRRERERERQREKRPKRSKYENIMMKWVSQMPGCIGSSLAIAIHLFFSPYFFTLRNAIFFNTL